MSKKVTENISQIFNDKGENTEENAELLKQADEFIEKYQQECEGVLKSWEQNVYSSSLSDKSLTSINKKIEKIQKLKFNIEGEMIILKDKLVENAKNLGSMIDENSRLRKEIEAEAGRRGVLEKLSGDLKAKLESKC